MTLVAGGCRWPGEAHCLSYADGPTGVLVTVQGLGPHIAGPLDVTACIANDCRSQQGQVSGGAAWITVPHPGVATQQPVTVSVTVTTRQGSRLVRVANGTRAVVPTFNAPRDTCHQGSHVVDVTLQAGGR